MSVDPKIVKTRVAKIEECSVRLGEIAETEGSDVFSTPGVQRETERLLQVAIQSMLDLGAHLISGLGYREPKDYTEVFDILGEEGVLPKRFAASVRGMAGLRNILVHDYLDVEPAKLLRTLRKVGDFEKFCRYLLRFLEK